MPWLACCFAGRLAEGVAAYERALALQPRHAEALYNLGVAYTEQGQLDKALFMWVLACCMATKLTTVTSSACHVAKSARSHQYLSPSQTTALVARAALSSGRPLGCFASLHCLPAGTRHRWWCSPAVQRRTTTWVSQGSEYLYHPTPCQPSAAALPMTLPQPGTACAARVAGLLPPACTSQQSLQTLPRASLGFCFGLFLPAGVLYREQGNMERAALCYQAALNARPNFPQASLPARHSRCCCRHCCCFCCWALCASPHCPLICSRLCCVLNNTCAGSGLQGLNNLAVIYTQQGRAQEALQLLQAAVMAAPTYAEAHNNLGVLQVPAPPGCVSPRTCIAALGACIYATFSPLLCIVLSTCWLLHPFLLTCSATWALCMMRLPATGAAWNWTRTTAMQVRLAGAEQ